MNRLVRANLYGVLGFKRGSKLSIESEITPHGWFVLHAQKTANHFLMGL